MYYSTYNVFNPQPNLQQNSLLPSVLNYLSYCPLKRLPQLLFQLAWDPRYIASRWTYRKHSFPLLQFNITSIVAYVFVAMGTCLPSRCLAMNIYSGSAIPTSCHNIITLTFFPELLPWNIIKLSTAQSGWGIDRSLGRHKNLKIIQGRETSEGFRVSAEQNNRCVWRIGVYTSH
jgi:hypothetical protein